MSRGFCFSAPATTEIYTLSLHDALPISHRRATRVRERTWLRPQRRRDGPVYSTVAGEAEVGQGGPRLGVRGGLRSGRVRSEEHTSELQSRLHLVCRLLLEKKKKNRVRTQ